MWQEVDNIEEDEDDEKKSNFDVLDIDNNHVTIKRDHGKIEKFELLENGELLLPNNKILGNRQFKK